VTVVFGYIWQGPKAKKDFTHYNNVKYSMLQIKMFIKENEKNLLIFITDT